MNDWSYYMVKDSMDWLAGYDLYSAERPFSACANDDQRKGWMDAQTDHDAWMQIDSSLCVNRDGVDMITEAI